MNITIKYRLSGLAVVDDEQNVVHVTYDWPVRAVVWPYGDREYEFDRPDIAASIDRMMEGAGVKHEELVKYFEGVFSRGLRPRGPLG